MPTVNSIALELIVEQGEATDDSDWVAVVEGFVNNALDEIAVATEWNSFRARDTFDTVIGTAEYQLPAGGREIIQLRYTETGEPITLWTVQEAARRSVLIETPGKARYWIEDGTMVDDDDVLYQFRLGPVPDAVLEIEVDYYFHPSAVASGSVLPIQDQIIVPVKDRVRAYLLERDQKYDAADRAQRRFDRAVDALNKREKRKVAAETRLKNTDINRQRKPEALFDPAHYRNF